MLLLIVLLVVIGVVLTLLLSAWTLWFQAYIYTETTAGIVWRGPAAGAAVTVVLLVWVLLDYAAPGCYQSFWLASSSEDSEFFPELRVPTPGGKEEVYKLRVGTRGDYRIGGVSSGKALPTRPQEIIVLEGSEKSVFKPERDDKGNFKQRSTTGFGRESKEPLRYIDEKGRVMLESSLGQLTRFRTGLFVGNVLLHLLLLAVLFVALWLLLGFQWAHALGQAIVVWLVLLLFVLPHLLRQAEAIAQQRALARATAFQHPRPNGQTRSTPGSPSMTSPMTNAG